MTLGDEPVPLWWELQEMLGALALLQLHVLRVWDELSASNPPSWPQKLVLRSLCSSF